MGMGVEVPKWLKSGQGAWRGPLPSSGFLGGLLESPCSFFLFSSFYFSFLPQLGSPLPLQCRSNLSHQIKELTGTAYIAQENSIQYPVITYHGKESGKEQIHVFASLSHFGVHLKVTQHGIHQLCFSIK